MRPHPLLALLSLSLSLAPVEGRGEDLTWLAKPKRAPVIEAFTASAPSIMLGNSVTLSWTVTGTSPTLSIDQGVGTVTGTSVSVSPTSTTTYTLTATNVKGQVTAQTSVTVNGLFAEDAQTVCHVWWNGTALQQSGCGGSWAMQGTVSQVAASGSTPPGAGGFASTAYYYLGTGNDSLDFVADWGFCAAYRGGTAASAWLIGNQTGATGWLAALPTGFTFRTYPGPVNVAAAGTASATGTNVMCGGRTSTNVHAKANLGAMSSQAGATIAAATTAQARIGYVAVPFDGIVYELIWFTDPSDVRFTAFMNSAKARAGITAW